MNKRLPISYRETLDERARKVIEDLEAHGWILRRITANTRTGRLHSWLFPSKEHQNPAHFIVSVVLDNGEVMYAQAGM